GLGHVWVAGAQERAHQVRDARRVGGAELRHDLVHRVLHATQLDGPLAVGPSQHAVGGAPVAVFRQPDAGDVGEEQPPDAAGVGDVQVAEGEYGDAVRDAGQQGCDLLFRGQGAQVVVEVPRVGVDDQHRRAAVRRGDLVGGGEVAQVGQPVV